MRIVVLGANGRTGKHVVQLALDAGATVTAVVRDTNKRLDVKHDNLSHRFGDPCDRDFLKRVFSNQDAVISTLGGRSPSRKATAVYSRSGKAIADAAASTYVKRIAVTSSALLFPPIKFIDHVLRMLVPNVVRNASRMEAALNAYNLNVTIARCGFLNDEETSGYRSCEDSLPTNGGSVSRMSLANFLIDSIYQNWPGHRVFGVSAQSMKKDQSTARPFSDATAQI